MTTTTKPVITFCFSPCPAFHPVFTSIHMFLWACDFKQKPVCHSHPFCQSKPPPRLTWFFLPRRLFLGNSQSRQSTSLTILWCYLFSHVGHMTCELTLSCSYVSEKERLGRQNVEVRCEIGAWTLRRNTGKVVLFMQLVAASKSVWQLL